MVKKSEAFGRNSRVQLPTARAQFSRALLGWYRVNARPLPWRQVPSLYSTVVSEFMLQQTQVATVLPYHARWLAELPDFATLAAASEAHVLKLWEGLGYYARVHNLQQVAQLVAKLPEPPRTPGAWQLMPGVGPYTAAAITSIAFGAPVACVDGNVVRILARLTANRAPFRDSASAAKAFTPLATQLLTPGEPGDHNQAMMELGATVCLRQNPLCLTCPVREFCAACQRGDSETYPNLAPRKMEQVAVTRVWCERQGALLLHLAAKGARRFANMHELPTAGQAGLTEAKAAKGRLLARKRRSITRYQITETIHAVPAPRGKLPPGLVWVPRKSLETITLSGPHRRWVKEILSHR